MGKTRFFSGKVLAAVLLGLSAFMILGGIRIYVMSGLSNHQLELFTIILLLIVLPGFLVVLVWRHQEQKILRQQEVAIEFLQNSQRRYKYLFRNNPVPMWIYRVSDLKFLEVNQAAIEKYGYSKNEFASMDLTQIRPPSDIDLVIDEINKPRPEYYRPPGLWKHQLRDGRTIEVEIHSHRLDYNGEKAALAMAYDVTERETEVKDLWDNAPCGYHTLDSELNIVRMNNTELQWLGYSADEVVNKMKITDLLLPAGKRNLLEGFENLLQQGGVKDIENEFIRKDGSILPVLLTVKVIRNQDGSLAQIRATVVDNTILRSARYDRDEKFRMVAENSFDEIFMFDMSLNYTYVSPAVLKLRGYTVEEAMNQSITAGMTPASGILASRLIREQMELVYANPLPRLDPITIELEILCKDGSTVWTEVKCGFVYGIDGKPIGALGIIRDIGERKHMVEELIRSRDKAEESDRLKSAFLANMSHEIRTPLNAIVGFSDLLNQENDPAEKDKYVGAINNGADLLLQILEDILLISRIDTGELIIRPVSISISSLFSELEKQLRATILKKCPEGQTLAVAVDKGKCPDIISLDETRFKIIMNNLFDNGVKFTSTGKITIGYGPGCARNVVRFFVRDTGIGIREDQQELIFERFRKGDHSLSRRFGGTGLGLAISKSLAEIMGGTMGVISKVGKGSEFWFELPVDPNLN